MKYQVNVKITKQETVNLDLKEIKRIALDLIYEMYDWKPSYYISEDGKKVLEDVEYYTSHKFDITEIVRKTKPKDKFISKLVKDIINLKAS